MPSQPDARAARRSFVELAWLVAALVLACVALWPALRGEFVYDDRILIQQNPTIRSLEGLRTAWDSAYWDFLQPQTAKQLGYWRPLTALTLHLGWRLGAGEPWGFHVLSLALHLASIAAVFHLARRLSRDATAGFFTAVLFGLHPVQVEAVAWISAVNDPLYGAAVLWGLVAWLGWRERGSRGVPLVSALLFALALLAKENAVAFVPLALALDLGRVPRERPEGERTSRLAGLRPFWRAHGAVLAVVVAWWLARAAVFGEWSAGVGRVTTELNITGFDPWWLRLELFGGFVGLAAWPSSLSLFREIDPVLPRGDASFLVACGWALAWLLATGVALKARARPALVGLLVLAAGVLPALVRFESLGRFVLSDRFLYVSVAGLAFLVAWLAIRRLPRLVARSLLVLLVVAAGWRSHARTLDWRDEESLFRATVAASPDSVYARWGLGRVLLERFKDIYWTRPLQRDDLRLIDEAQAAFEWVQDQINPPDGGARSEHLFYTPEDNLQAHCGLGWCHLMRAFLDPDYGFEAAQLLFQETSKHRPDAAEPLVGLGVALMNQGRLPEAEEALASAVRIDPSMEQAWHNYGQVALRRGDWKAAAERFEHVLALFPQDPQTELWLGIALVEGDGDPQRAREVLENARAAMHGSPMPSLQLGALEARQGHWREALRWFDEVLHIDPRHGQAQLFRAKVLLQLGENDHALAALGEACRLLPSDFEAHFLTGRLLAERGFGEAARPYLERALAIQPEGPYAAEIQATLELLPPPGEEDAPTDR